MRLKLNKEFAVRHLAVALLMAALGGWFAYDGYVKYPAMDAATLYREAHGGEDAATRNRRKSSRQMPCRARNSLWRLRGDLRRFLP